MLGYFEQSYSCIQSTYLTILTLSTAVHLHTNKHVIQLHCIVLNLTTMPRIKMPNIKYFKIHVKRKITVKEKYSQLICRQNCRIQIVKIKQLFFIASFTIMENQCLIRADQGTRKKTLPVFIFVNHLPESWFYWRKNMIKNHRFIFNFYLTSNTYNNKNVSILHMKESAL